MSLDNKNIRYCDECGRTIRKAHRIFQGKDYCASCYPRVFQKVKCTLCDSWARPHRYSNEPAICRDCNIRTRRCLRCDASVPRAGKIINDKPVCPSCTPYFNDPKLCTSCGKSSLRVLCAPRFGLDNPMCESCRRKLTHKTCSFCGKHRSVHGVTNDGKSYCVSCIPGQHHHHLCPGCGVQMPGGGRSRCRSCLNLARVMKEADLHSLALNHRWARDTFIKFAIWLHERSGDQPNCFSIFVAHEPFFERLDAYFQHSSEISESTLLETLGVAMIRRHLLASVFLQESLGVRLSSDAKVDSAERSRIQDKLIKNTREPWAPLLKKYSAWLSEKDISLRTQRLYLRAAEKFCQMQGVSSDNQCSTNLVSNFLKKNIGSRASLYKFITYCRTELGWPVEMPSVSVSPSTSLAHRLERLLQRIKKQGVESADLGTLSKTLALAFGYEHKKFLAHSWSLSKMEDMVILRNGSDTLVVPPGYVAIAQNWISRRVLHTHD